MARIQKIESDSAFSSAVILDGKILTYKTYEEGRVVHKAKLPNGSVVEITPKVDLSAYYTSAQVNELLQEYVSDSLFTSLENRVAVLQTATGPQRLQGQPPISVHSDSAGHSIISLTYDSNALEVAQQRLTTRLKIKKLDTPQAGFAATYQLEGADGSPIGDKINIIRDRYIQPPTFIKASQQDLIVDSTLTLNDPYLKFVFYSQSDSASVYTSAMYVPLKDLVDTYTTGTGIYMQDNQISLVADTNSETSKYLQIGSNTIGLKGIDQAISNAKQDLLKVIADLSNSITQNYYNKNEIDGFLGSFSNSLSYIKDLITNLPINNFNYKTIQQNYTASDRDFLICQAQQLIVTLPEVQQGIVICTATGSGGSNISVVPAAGDRIQISESNSTSQGILLEETYSTLLLCGDQNKWIIAAAAIKAMNINEVEQALQQYYTKTQIDDLLSDSESTQETAIIVQSFSTIDTNNEYTLQYKGIPIGIITNSGQYYPIEKFSVQLQSTYTKLKLTPYMAYQNMATFTGTWTVIYTKLD